MALQALFGAGARDDVLPVTPAELRPEAPLLLPKLFETLLDRVHLGLRLGVVTLGQPVPHLDAAIAELFDLPVNGFQRAHMPLQRRHGPAIPDPRKGNTGLPRRRFWTTTRSGQAYCGT